MGRHRESGRRQAFSARRALESGAGMRVTVSLAPQIAWAISRSTHCPPHAPKRTRLCHGAPGKVRRSRDQETPRTLVLFAREISRGSAGTLSSTSILYRTWGRCACTRLDGFAKASWRTLAERAQTSSAATRPCVQHLTRERVDVVWKHGSWAGKFVW